MGVLVDGLKQSGPKQKQLGAPCAVQIAADGDEERYGDVLGLILLPGFPVSQKRQHLLDAGIEMTNGTIRRHIRGECSRCVEWMQVHDVPR